MADVYDKLKPVTAQKLIGRWKGSSFDTGHPTHAILKTFRWAGKDFRSIDDVDPIVVETDSGERKCYRDYGNARVCSTLVLLLVRLTEP